MGRFLSTNDATIKGDFTANTGTFNSSLSTGTFNASSTSTMDTINPSSGTSDLGNSSARWRNIYTNDLNLSNGIGDYTIVEGEDQLYLYNNKTGKVFKFLIQEVDPNDAPPKQDSEE